MCLDFPDGVDMHLSVAIFLAPLGLLQVSFLDEAIAAIDVFTDLENHRLIGVDSGLNVEDFIPSYFDSVFGQGHSFQVLAINFDWNAIGRRPCLTNWSRVCAGSTSWAGSVAVLLVLRQLLIFAVSLFPFEALD
jgi:hypothetical protein